MDPLYVLRAGACLEVELLPFCRGDANMASSPSGGWRRVRRIASNHHILFNAHLQKRANELKLGVPCECGSYMFRNKFLFPQNNNQTS